MLDALDLLERAVEESVGRGGLLLERIRWLRAERAAGRRYREIVQGEDRPVLVELASANVEALRDAARALRRAKAEALYAEGMTMDEIAKLYGVTRQRVSALLREHGP